jgi:hypothetical protein
MVLIAELLLVVVHRLTTNRVLVLTCRVRWACQLVEVVLKLLRRLPVALLLRNMTRNMLRLHILLLSEEVLGNAGLRLEHHLTGLLLSGVRRLVRLRSLLQKRLRFELLLRLLLLHVEGLLVSWCLGLLALRSLARLLLLLLLHVVAVELEVLLRLVHRLALKLVVPRWSLLRRILVVAGLLHGRRLRFHRELRLEIMRHLAGRLLLVFRVLAMELRSQLVVGRLLLLLRIAAVALQSTHLVLALHLRLEVGLLRDTLSLLRAVVLLLAVIEVLLVLVHNGAFA